MRLMWDLRADIEARIENRELQNENRGISSPPGSLGLYRESRIEKSEASHLPARRGNVNSETGILRAVRILPGLFWDLRGRKCNVVLGSAHRILPGI